MGRLVVAMGCAALAAAGCGQSAAPLPPDCTQSVEAIVSALAAAPGAVALHDGTTLSRCVANGQDDADMQNVGLMFHRAAERLRARALHSPTAAVQLGYLVGATRRGASRTNGVMAELVRRVELVAGRLSDEAPAPIDAALRAGLRAGEARG
jgi:hypothetical protein